MEEPISKILTDPTAGFLDSPGCFESLPPRRYDEHWEWPEFDREWAGVEPKLRSLILRLGRGEARWPLYLHGGVGAGKTAAALVICDMMDGGRYWTVKRVMQAMVEQRSPWDTSGARLAVLDELGLRDTNVPNDTRGKWEYDAVKEFLDWREQRPAVYVSNHDLRTVRQLYDKRIASRLGAGTVYVLDGPDRRFQGANPMTLEECKAKLG